MSRLYFYFLLVLFATSCKQVSVIQRIGSETAQLVEFRNGEKTVGFIPMHHIGKPLFYVDVRLLVDSFKNAGYIVFYESASPEKIGDSILKDTYQRKLRKMLGVHIDSTGYERHLPQTAFFRDLVNQPPYSELGLTETDKRVDIPNNRLVDAYEQAFGPIQLEPADYSIPLEESYNPSLRLPKKNVFSIIIDHRDKHLARGIQEASYKKILVLYGAFHMEGTFAALQQMDPSWKRKKLKVRRNYKTNISG